jgi:hypothetical protein
VSFNDRKTVVVGSTQCGAHQLIEADRLKQPARHHSQKASSHIAQQQHVYLGQVAVDDEVGRGDGTDRSAHRVLQGSVTECGILMQCKQVKCSPNVIPDMKVTLHNHACSVKPVV